MTIVSEVGSIPASPALSGIVSALTTAHADRDRDKSAQAGQAPHVLRVLYPGGVFGREPEWTLPWIEDDSIWQGADATIAALELDPPATVPWWDQTKRNTTLGVLLTHMIAETSQHLGHADIIREQIDGTAGSDAAELGDSDWWHTFTTRSRPLLFGSATSHPEPGIGLPPSPFTR
jgi:hypothetical protein